MRILYHHRTLGDGAEGIHISEMVKAFEKLGHMVRMAGPAAGMENKGSDARPGRLSALKSLFKGAAAYECLELGYNLVGFAGLCKAVREFKPHLIYDRYITFNYAPVAVGRLFDIPVILEVNAPLAYERANEADEKLRFRRLAVLLERITASHADHTIVVSTPLKTYFSGIGVPGDKLVVAPNGVNLTTFKPGPKSESLMAELGLDASHIIVGFTGILRPWHGIDLLVEAFARLFKKHPETRLLLVGDGTIRGDIEAHAQTLGCRSGLKITGRVSHEKVREYIRIFDIAVSPKTTFYASPMKIPEYMAMGKPVIAPDTPNITDLLSHGEAGLLFKPGDVTALYEQLDQMLKAPGQRELMGKTALETARKSMSWENTAKGILSRLHPGCVR